MKEAILILIMFCFGYAYADDGSNIIRVDMREGFGGRLATGIEYVLNNIALPEKSNVNLYTASPKDLWGLETLPLTRSNAAKAALSSVFLKSHLPESLINYFCEP